MSAPQRPWTVLLIGGSSGTGKTTIAAEVGRRLGTSWLQVDDLRLALQRSRVALPTGTEALYFFEETPDVWRLPPERLRDGLIAVGDVMTPAIEIVVENHVETIAATVIEGDGILPSLLARPSLRRYLTDGRVRAVFLVEPDEEAILANMLARGRGVIDQTDAALRVQAHAYWLFGRWLAGEAARLDLPVMETRPWATLAQRILAPSNEETIPS